jgi:hypothetical protein
VKDDARSEKGRLEARTMGGVAGGDDEGEDRGGRGSGTRRFREPYVCITEVIGRGC